MSRGNSTGDDIRRILYGHPQTGLHFRISWRWYQSTTVSKLKREREFALVVAGVASREICPEPRSVNCKRNDQREFYCDTNETFSITNLCLNGRAKRTLGNHSYVSKL